MCGRPCVSALATTTITSGTAARTSGPGLELRRTAPWGWPAMAAVPRLNHALASSAGGPVAWKLAVRRYRVGDCTRGR